MAVDVAVDAVTAQRIQLRRTKGWRLPPGAVSVARPSRWGNPFTVESCIEAGFALDVEQARAVVVSAYRDWLRGNTWAAGSSIDWDERRQAILSDVHQLAGRDLACWCPLDGRPCHADVLLDLANREAP